VLEVGRITKAHGIKGEVLVELVTDRVERVAPGSVLTTGDGGKLVVVASRAHQGKWIVAFEGVPTRTDAEAMRGTVLLAEPIEGAGDTLWVHELIGADVVEVDGTPRGTVESVLANPASDLLVLDGGALVPLAFVVGHEPGRVVIDPPEGLFEL
jgi:16S rRNA processing protein RimM